MKNKIIKITYIFIIFGIILLNLKLVFAITESELEEQISEIDEQISDTNTEIAGLEEEMTEALTQINRLNIQIQEYEEEISDLEDELEEANSVLEQKKQELQEITEEYNKKKAQVEERLVAMYESSKTTYLDLLVGSDDLTDFLSKYYLLEEIAECDNELLEIVESAKNEVEDEEKELESATGDIETIQERLVAKQGALEVLVKDKTNLISTLTAEELELQEQLEQFEEDKKQIQEELENLSKQNAITVSITPSSCGYISPLLGKTSKNITTGYYGYSGHTGVDFAVSSGTEVLAVKSGTVVISAALKNSNGTYRSYRRICCY